MISQLEMVRRRRQMHRRIRELLAVRRLTAQPRVVPVPRQPERPATDA